jgi:hypothetical protein
VPMRSRLMRLLLTLALAVALLAPTAAACSPNPGGGFC